MAKLVNLNFGLRPSLGGPQIMLWSERKTDPKTEMIHCLVLMPAVGPLCFQLVRPVVRPSCCLSHANIGLPAG